MLFFIRCIGWRLSLFFSRSIDFLFHDCLSHRLYIHLWSLKRTLPLLLLVKLDGHLMQVQYAVPTFPHVRQTSFPLERSAREEKWQGRARDDCLRVTSAYQQESNEGGGGVPKYSNIAI